MLSLRDLRPYGNVPFGAFATPSGPSLPLREGGSLSSVGMPLGGFRPFGTPTGTLRALERRIGDPRGIKMHVVTSLGTCFPLGLPVFPLGTAITCHVTAISCHIGTPTPRAREIPTPTRLRRAGNSKLPLLRKCRGDCSRRVYCDNDPHCERTENGRHQ
jgi:hypothetical protein